MHRVQLTIQESVYAKFMNFAETFKADEIKIDINQINSEKSDLEFQRNKAELQKDYETMMSGKSESFSIEQFEAIFLK